MTPDGAQPARPDPADPASPSAAAADPGLPAPDSASGVPAARAWAWPEILARPEDGAPPRALLIVAQSSRDPRIAPFCGPGRLGPCFVLWPAAGPPRLAFISPMERGEAARAGLELLTPEALDVQRFARDGDPTHVFLANVLGRALHLCEVASGPVAVTGSLPAGRLLACLRLLEAEGWSFQAAETAVDLLRKPKTPAELEGVRQAAEGTCAAFRRLAEILAA
ncbi:MAG: hypothetical protein MI919_42410, partial [Holophagales bacterium]|nr:hypothetical protein [Holophagales bacterium]